MKIVKTEVIDLINEEEAKEYDFIKAEVTVRSDEDLNKESLNELDYMSGLEFPGGTEYSFESKDKKVLVKLKCMNKEQVKLNEAYLKVKDSIDENDEKFIEALKNLLDNFEPELLTEYFLFYDLNTKNDMVRVLNISDEFIEKNDLKARLYLILESPYVDNANKKEINQVPFVQKQKSEQVFEALDKLIELI